MITASETRTTRLLKGPDGGVITDQFEMTPGLFRLADDNINDNNEIELSYDRTEHDYDNQHVDYMFGEMQFHDEGGDWYLAGDLVIETMVEDEDGNETITTEPFTGGIQPPLERAVTRKFNEYALTNRALELAQWVIFSKALATPKAALINNAAHERIKNRAIAYAEQEGVLPQLQAILNSTHPELLPNH